MTSILNQSRLVILTPLFLIAGQSIGNENTPAPDVPRGRIEVVRTPAQLIDAATIETLSDVLEPDEAITWRMFVPDTYDPDKPAGLVVYISPTKRGYMPRGWQPVFYQENLIWISADSSGNNVNSKRRMLFAVVGPQIAAENYRIDPNRVYLAGFSGGGKMAAMVSIHFANLFKGGLYIGGTEFWSEDPPALFSNVVENRYVFLAGDDDFNRGLTTRIYNRYKKAGVPNIKLMIIPNMAHSTPGRDDFQEAIDFLDNRE